jgi:hypothetical protein
MNINESVKIKQIFDGVWRDRTAIVAGRGVLTGEAALEQAVYWRLYKAGRDPEASAVDCAPFLSELVQQYRNEAAPEGYKAAR